jgi:hypothetical protein
MQLQVFLCLVLENIPVLEKETRSDTNGKVWKLFHLFIFLFNDSASYSQCRVFVNNIDGRYRNQQCTYKPVADNIFLSVSRWLKYYARHHILQKKKGKP